MRGPEGRAKLSFVMLVDLGNLSRAVRYDY